MFKEKYIGIPSPAKPSDNLFYRLYFKGLVKKKSVAGYGFAICDEENNILYQMKGPIFGSDISVLEVELTALNLGLTEAVRLGINHISIYCDYLPLYRLVTRISMLQENKCCLLMDNVQRIRNKIKSSFPVFVDKADIKYAYELAMETLVSEIIIYIDPTRKTTCRICLGDDISVDQMFSVEKCRHRFCSECVKRHIEVRLLERSLMRCPQHRCETKLTLRNCVNLLTPKLRKMWQQRIKEDLIPVTNRIYCPNPRCSALMSKTELSNSTKKCESKRCCFKCSEPFCINCKVLWHGNISCDDYKKLHPDSTENDRKLKSLGKQKMWRQCGKCQHMIQRSSGCVLISCRCGHKFCYQCGAEDGACSHYQDLIEPQPPLWALKLWILVLAVCSAFLIFYFLQQVLVHFLYSE